MIVVCEDRLLDPICISRVLRKWGARYAVLFGSVAEGCVTGVSDVDVAVKIGRRIDLVEMGELYTELQECTPRRLDLVILDDAEPVILWEALDKGRLIYSCGRECTMEYYEDRARAIDLISDLEPLLKMIRRRLENAFSRPARKGSEG